MPLWTFPGTITQVRGVHNVTATLDLGCKLYWNAVITVAGAPNTVANTEQLQELLPAGTRFLATCQPLTGVTVRAHLTLADGRDVASALRVRPPPALTAEYGGNLGKVWTYPATVAHLTDADTFAARIDMGGPLAYCNAVRLQHVNAPEKNTAEGQAALVWAERVLTRGLPITVVASKLEKYGRLLGTVLLPDGHDYARALVDAGHAVPYEGGQR